jgi:hypothetical protein
MAKQLEFEYWCLFVIWCLLVGIYFSAMREADNSRRDREEESWHQGKSIRQLQHS